MTGTVKREYRSDLRSAQARETRRSIVAAAARLFETDGYVVTTIDDVAAAAGVSRKTVFTAVGGKFALLKTALDWALAGDDEPVALADRTELQQVLQLRDPGALLRGWVHVLVDIDERVSGLHQALQAAAAVDAEARELVEQLQAQRLDGARHVVKRLVELGALRPGLTRAEAADLAWLAGDPVLFDRLARVRGWSRRRFENWLSTNVTERLLGQ